MGKTKTHPVHLVHFAVRTSSTMIYTISMYTKIRKRYVRRNSTHKPYWAASCGRGTFRTTYVHVVLCSTQNPTVDYRTYTIYEPRRKTRTLVSKTGVLQLSRNLHENLLKGGLWYKVGSR